MAAATRTQRTLWGLCTLWLLSELSLVGGLEMSTVPKFYSVCRQNVTLICEVISAQKLDIKRFYWMEKKDICDWMQPSNDTGFSCRSYQTENRYKFHLTIFNVQPHHKGTYHCKLRSNEGIQNGQTILRVQKCLGNADSTITPKDASCTFKDVFPMGSVLWNLGSINLTDLAKTNVTEDPMGRYTITSTVKVDHSLKGWYNCSLWMPVENENKTENYMLSVMAFRSAGCVVITHWICLMLPVLLGVLMV